MNDPPSPVARMPVRPGMTPGRRAGVIAILGVLVAGAVFRFSPLWPGPSLPAGADDAFHVCEIGA